MPQREHTSVEIIRRLQPWSLRRSTANVKGDVYEDFLGKTFRDDLEWRHVNRGSKYYPLFEYLQRSGQDEVTLTFAEIEALLELDLPPSARTQRAWWSNRSQGALQASAWMEAGYHAEDLDFKPFEGTTVWDIFGKNTSKDVIMQFDTGNAMLGGVSRTGLVDFMKRYPGRSRTIHFKEYSETEDKGVLGEGKVNWPEFLKVCEADVNIEWYIIEQEKYPYSRLETIRRSIKNLKQIIEKTK